MKISISLNEHEELKRIISIISEVRAENGVVNRSNIVRELKRREDISPEKSADYILSVLKQKKFAVNL